MSRVYVVVLGDLGRSPRMKNHALSLARQGLSVDLLGYAGSKLPNEVIKNKRITVRTMPKPPNVGSGAFNYLFKLVWQSIFLFFSLPILLNVPKFLLLQNPPSVPALPVLYFYCLLHWWVQPRLVVDWHNYGYTIMSLKHGSAHKLVQLYRWIESKFGQKAHAAFCVTQAMKEDLGEHWGVRATVLYDRAPTAFTPNVSLKERHQLFRKLGETYPIFLEGFVKQVEDFDDTVFTEVFAKGRVALKSDRPALLVSSTSWTEDEDFQVLFDALEMYNAGCIAEKNAFPNLVCVITGKGPLKEFYLDLIAERQWRHVEVVAPWLEQEDYPKILAAADLGVCLHKSSSGLDLPMKVVDMFGCGLPVFAIDFKALPELVRNEENGLVFGDSKDLFRKLQMWFKGFPVSTEGLHKRYRSNLREFQSLRWAEYWDAVALSTFK